MEAMPIAPPRLRIVLKRALAIFRRSGGTEPSAILVAGTMHKRMEKPRRNCGQKSSRPVHSEVIGVIRQREKAKRNSPTEMSRRGSIFRESLAIKGADTTMARPVLKTACPICKALKPAILARNSGRT
jgi:hypothetical protein